MGAVDQVRANHVLPQRDVVLVLYSVLPPPVLHLPFRW